MRAPHFLLLIPLLAMAQAPASVQATGSATIHVAPDQAQLNAGVITQATNAQAAAEQNATSTTAMLNALKAVLGTSGTIQTIGYSISPRYSNTNPPAITGYIASNTVQITTVNLNLVGPLIDAANGAGANNVSGISFGLQDPEPATQQALGRASKIALAHAAAIAEGLGRKTGAVISATEGGSVVPVGRDFAATAGAATPVQTGTVSVSATVTVSVLLTQ